MNISDIRTVLYFCLEKGDPERMIHWDRLLPTVKAQFPELIDAWEAKKTADKRFHEVAKSVSEKIEEQSQ